MGVVAFVCVALYAQPGHAGGMSLPGTGPQPQARAGAFTAKADDPSALAHNPAGFAKLDGTVVTVGFNLVDFSLSYQRTGSYEASGRDEVWEGQPYPTIKDESHPDLGIGEYQAIPLVAVSTDFGRPSLPVRAAIGLFAPQGYPGRDFADNIDVGVGEDAPAPQRYDIMEQHATVVAPTLAVAYSPLDVLDVGARFSWGYAKTGGKKALWSVRNYEEWPGRDAVFTLDAKDAFVPSFGLGLLYRPASWVELGAAYNSRISIRSKGTGTSDIGGGILEGLETIPIEDQYTLCGPGGEVGALISCLDFDIPQNATVAARYVFRDESGAERADVELDVRWEDWSESTVTTIIVDGQISVDGAGYLPLNASVNRHGYQDVFSFRLGGAYSFPIGRNKLILRAGAAYDTRTAPLSWTRVDIDNKRRATLTTGIAFETSRFRVDLGGGRVLEPDNTVAQCQPPDGPSLDSPGCDGTGEDAPVLDRTAPDPGQPLQGPLNAIESPFNAGTYESGYTLFSLGLTTWF